jgi:formate dehydrogenase
VLEAIAAGAVEAPLPDYIDLADVPPRRRLSAAVRLHQRSRKPMTVIAELESSALRGLGGAGFPAGREVADRPRRAGAALMAINIDEGEPARSRTRYYLERDPHRFSRAC